jgi:low temperature requirement protein LtrA
MKRNLLRSRDSHAEERVGSIELFFDLVFVFAVTQISHNILLHPDALGFAQAGILFVAIWWVWVETAWFTNWLDVRFMPVRMLLFALMGGALVMSISLPEAFAERGLVFVLSYLVIQLGRHGFMLLALARHNRENFHNFVRITIWALIEAPFWIAGALQESLGARMILWGVALSILNLAPMIGFVLPRLGRSETRSWDIEGHHFSERCGLFIIIALGESIVVTGASFGESPWSMAAIAAFASAFIGTIAMWWLYFDVGAERAARRLAVDKDPGRMARLAYTYFHMPIVAGIVVSAASDGMAVVQPAGHVGLGQAVALLGGPALYLFGNLLFKRSSGGEHFPLSHLVGLGLLAATAPFAPHLSPLLLSAIATGALVLTAAWELRSLRDTRRALEI